MNDPALDPNRPFRLYAEDPPDVDANPAADIEFKPFKVAEEHYPIAWFVVGQDEPETAVKVANVLRVVNLGKGAARLYIDGVMFGYATTEGFDVHTGPRRHERNMPAVTLTIVARRVEVVDDVKHDLPPVPQLLDVPTSTA